MEREPIETITPEKRAEPDRRETMVQNNITAIVIALASVCVLSIVFIIYLSWRMRRLEGGYDLLTRGSEGKNFVEIVNENIVQTLKLRDEVESLSERYAFVLRRMAGAVQHAGVVRYDAFRDLGGLLSFSIALLDDRGNGLVVSSIYGRSESRTYAKPIIERDSSYLLSPEEKEAIRLAMQSRETGALPMEATDHEHEEKIASLKLFHDREYIETSREEERRAELVSLASEMEGRPRRRSAGRAAERDMPRQRAARANIRTSGDERRPEIEDRPPDVKERPARARSRRTAAVEPGETPRRPRPEHPADNPTEPIPVPTKEGIFDVEKEITEQETPRQKPASRPQSLNTPVERLRRKEPNGD
ncbi:MAG: DUF4446 family protein [Actinobacteria bacterium]|nr:DUF4446 family protein [Actinomycetota bacterium]